MDDNSSEIFHYLLLSCCCHQCPLVPKLRASVIGRVFCTVCDFMGPFLLPMCLKMFLHRLSIALPLRTSYHCVVQRGCVHVYVSTHVCVHACLCYIASGCPRHVSAEACPNTTAAKSSSQASQNRKWIVLLYSLCSQASVLLSLTFLALNPSSSSSLVHLAISGNQNIMCSFSGINIQPGIKPTCRRKVEAASVLIKNSVFCYNLISDEGFATAAEVNVDFWSSMYGVFRRFAYLWKLQE